MDDDPDTLQWYAVALDALGYEVLTVQDPATALRIAKNVPAAAIILDMVMPVQDGAQVLEGLRADERTRDIPVLVVTCVPSDDTVWEGRSLAWDGYVTKPVKVDALDRELRKILA